MSRAANQHPLSVKDSEASAAASAGGGRLDNFAQTHVFTEPLAPFSPAASSVMQPAAPPERAAEAAAVPGASLPGECPLSGVAAALAAVDELAACRETNG